MQHLIGFGTWKLTGLECENSIKKALELGYRHIDTADMYQNHKEIGKAIKIIDRKDLFLTSKLSHLDLAAENVEINTRRFLEELDVNYLDLLLIHWPNPAFDLIETLKVMEEIKRQGLVKEIGVSNFVGLHLKEIQKAGIAVFNNQIELHPYLQRKKLVKECKEQNISITAYRPLAKGAFEKDLVLQQLGEKHGKSASQIVLRWLIQQGFYAIPKASNIEHMKENIDLFDFGLDKDDLIKIDSLNRNERYCVSEGFPVYED